jgi:hypothetical protein
MSLALCSIGCGAATGHGAGSTDRGEREGVRGIKSLVVNADGSVVGCMRIPGEDREAVFCWDPVSGKAVTIWKGEKDASIGLMPGSTCDFACWDVYTRGTKELLAVLADADAQPASYWYDGTEVRRDHWRSGFPSILRLALPGRQSYLVTRQRATPDEIAIQAISRGLFEVRALDGMVLNELNLDALGHDIVHIAALYLENRSDEAGPLLWLATQLWPSPLRMDHRRIGAFASERPRTWIDVLSWKEGDAAHLDTLELIHESEVWNMAAPRDRDGVLVLTSPSAGAITNTHAWQLSVTPLWLKWDAERGRIQLEGGEPLAVLGSPENTAAGASYGFSDGAAYMSSDSLFFVLGDRDKRWWLNRMSFENYAERQVLGDPVCREAWSVAVCPASDLLATWNGFTFDLYGPSDGDKWADYGKVGTWTLRVDEKGQMQAVPME